MKDTVIEKEGKFYKKCGVVILFTEKASRINSIFNKGVLNYSTQMLEHISSQHLYITSDDEIKEDDWFYDELSTDKIYQRKNSNMYSLPEGTKKIIATTDTSLGLPQPSDKFIQAYIDDYNKGEKIERVLVEYENFCGCELLNYNSKEVVKLCPGKCDRPRNGLRLVTSKLKNNNIIIKKVKDSWNWSEVKQLLWGCFTKDYKPMSPDDIADKIVPAFEEWLKSKNL